MTCEIVPLSEDLINRFEYDGERLWIIGKASIRQVLETALKLGDGYAAVKGKQVIAVAGMFQISPGVGHTWMYFNKAQATCHCKTILKAIRSTVELIATKRGFHRIQTYVEAHDEQSARFTKAYGLAKECTMRAYGAQGQDMDVYAKVRHGR